MKIRNRRILFVIIAIILVGGCLLVYNWHYRKYIWPAEIQKKLLGSVVGHPADLIRQEGYSAYGEGLFRWEYVIRKNSRDLEHLCAGEALAKCRINRSIKLEDGVYQSVTYSSGILSVEEIWT